MTTMNQNSKDQLACLNNHNLAQLFTEQIADTKTLFGEFATEDLMTMIRNTVEEDFRQKTAGEEAFTLLEKALFLGLSFEEQSDALVKLSTILHNTKNLFLAEGVLDITKAPGYFGELIGRHGEIQPDEEMAFLEDARFALKLLSATFHRYELLTMNIQARIEAADSWSKEMADNHGDWNSFTEIMFDYYDACYGIIEKFLAATGELKKAEAVTFLNQLNGGNNSISGLQILEFLLGSHIISLYEAMGSAECPQLEDDASNKLAFTVLAGSKTLLSNGQDIDLVMDFAEKALLFAGEDDLITSIVNHMAEIPGMASETPGSLYKLMQPYAQLADTIAESDESCKMEISILTAELGGLDNVIRKVQSLHKLFEMLNEKCAKDSSSICEYYGNCSSKLAALEVPLRNWSTYR